MGRIALLVDRTALFDFDDFVVVELSGDPAVIVCGGVSITLAADLYPSVFFNLM